MSAYQCPSARCTRCTVLGVPSIGRCILILRDLPILAGTCRCLLSASSHTSRLVPYCRSWRECQRFGFLKRGKPTSAIPSFLAARKRLRDLESRSANICTVVAGTCSPCPLKALSRSYLEGNVCCSAYCVLTISSI